MPETYAIFYDPNCPFCEWCRKWIESKPAFVPLKFLDCYGEHTGDFAGSGVALGVEIVVLGPQRSVWQGTDAYLVCLWMLREFRWIAVLLENPILYAFASVFFETLTRNRRLIGALMGLPKCNGHHCEATLQPSTPYR